MKHFIALLLLVASSVAAQPVEYHPWLVKLDADGYVAAHCPPGLKEPGWVPVVVDFKKVGSLDVGDVSDPHFELKAVQVEGKAVREVVPRSGWEESQGMEKANRRRIQALLADLRARRDTSAEASPGTTLPGPSDELYYLLENERWRNSAKRSTRRRKR